MDSVLASLDSRYKRSQMDLNTAFLKLQLRAEKGDPSVLVATFVDVGHLFAILSNNDHQILYGRRGTGKTHALKYLVEEIRGPRAQVPVYVDMRTMGSSGGLYSDTSTPLTERATRLLMDTLAAIHDDLATFALGDSEAAKRAARELLPRLDSLADACGEIRVTGGTVERELTQTAESAEKTSTGLSAGYPFSAKLEDTTSHDSSRTVEVRRVEKGQEAHRVHFGAASQRLGDVVKALPSQRLWIILDEWSVVPLELQPLLADFLRRCVFPVSGVTVKIGAIEHRSRFRSPTESGDYVGLELGADTSANLELDDFMVFNNDAERAKGFFRDLLYRHVRAVFAAEQQSHPALVSADALVTAAFTQHNAFDEYVRAAEGVPRDAVNILGLAAQKAGEERISVPHVRVAARQWYQRDKLAAASANTDASDLLHWIMEEVISRRHARAFLLEQGKRHPLIEALYDSRVLHVVKRGVSGGDIAGVRFNAYGLDYGCYVDLISTKKAPRGLLFPPEEDEVADVEVPQDDYRSIRRAILDIEQLERHMRTRGS
jgi:hypothetical protein